MVGMTVKDYKTGFFDREHVQRSMAAHARKALSMFGAFVKQRAKTSIRKRKGPSPPGRPPHSQRGILRKSIHFAYDRSAQSVVIGPVGFSARAEVTPLFEYGGIGRKRGYNKRPPRYEPRPYMHPAFEKEKPNLAEMWKNALKK